MYVSYTEKKEENYIKRFPGNHTRQEKTILPYTREFFRCSKCSQMIGVSFFGSYLFLLRNDIKGNNFHSLYWFKTVFPLRQPNVDAFENWNNYEIWLNDCWTNIRFSFHIIIWSVSFLIYFIISFYFWIYWSVVIGKRS